MKFIQVYQWFTPFLLTNTLFYDYIIIVYPFSYSWALGYFQFAVNTRNIYMYAFFENSNLIFFFLSPLWNKLNNGHTKTASTNHWNLQMLHYLEKGSLHM